MSELRDLYQEVIFEHARHPRNHHALTNANHVARGHNHLCGDQLTVYLHVADDVIEDVSFEGAGCAISTASASLMTEALKGKRLEQAGKLFETFHHMLTHGGTDSNAETGAALDKLEVMAGVHEFPARVKCATLAWHTLQAALKNRVEPVSTE
jgi:nitrogen fixation protein NifU and related proteins